MSLEEERREDQEDISFLDEKEFRAKFMLDPDIKEEFHGQFSHLDKNLAITNLRYERNGLNEPEEARGIARGLHVLNNKIHFKEVKKKVIVAYEEMLDEEGEKVIIPVFKEMTVIESKFPKTYHSIKSEFLTFTNTSASRMGHRVKAATSTTRIREESYEEKVAVANRWSPMKKNS